MSKDNLGDRMKAYESQETSRKALPRMPVIARLDGKAFHGFCKGLKRPFDERLHQVMMMVTKNLMEESGADVAYHQSDEITLIWKNDKPESQLWFDGKFFKLQSVLASIAAVWFHVFKEVSMPEKHENLAVFDCRVWQVPTLDEAINCLIWREQDATRNSIQMAAQSIFSHAQLHGMNTGDLNAMLENKGIVWGEYPDHFKKGLYMRRLTTVRRFTTDEIEKLPPKHDARTNPDLMIERTDIREIVMDPLAKISPEDRREIIFG